MNRTAEYLLTLLRRTLVRLVHYSILNHKEHKERKHEEQYSLSVLCEKLSELCG